MKPAAVLQPDEPRELFQLLITSWGMQKQTLTIKNKANLTQTGQLNR